MSVAVDKFDYKWGQISVLSSDRCKISFFSFRYTIFLSVVC
jgi:hypothetical protein